MKRYALQLDKTAQGDRGFCCCYHIRAQESSQLYLEDTRQAADLSETLLRIC
jgi:hypothetical protein